MCGGNPKHDAYGFRYWNNPGAFAEYRSKGSKGQFEGFLAALWNAAFTIGGPEYLSMAAGEAKRPRTYINSAYRNIYWRFGSFFILGALCVGIIIPWNDKHLQAILSGSDSSSGGSAAPYVMAMKNMQVQGLPHLVNALIITSIFSAGNTYSYCATRTLYSMALEGRAPRIFKKTTRKGTPVFAYSIVACFSLLSFLQLSDSSSIVIEWLGTLITGGQLIDYIVITATYISFYRACKAQGYDRRTFPYYGRLQPYCAYVAVCTLVLLTLFYGYKSFGPWDVATFFQNYTMQIVAPIFFIFWKLVKRTRMLKPSEVDLVWDRPAIDAYEATFTDPPQGIWEELLGIVTFGKWGTNIKQQSLGG